MIIRVVASMPPVPCRRAEWEHVFALLHALWGDAKSGTPYNREQKRKWARLLDALQYQATHGAGQTARGTSAAGQRSFDDGFNDRQERQVR
jgi:hypothetical protein